MNENRNRQEAELNEQALSGVSGGGDAQLAHAKAREYCNRCNRLRSNHCGHTTSELANYILENGDISISVNCPFYRS